MAVTIALNCNVEELSSILIKYGYCLSASVAADAAVKWYLDTYPCINGKDILIEINETLQCMGLPLLMTRTK